MRLTLESLTVLLIAISMGLALAHALEFPGKLRLDERTYLSVQTIYYSGFTIGGVAEPLAVIATFMLLLFPSKDPIHFWLVLVAFSGVLGIQAVHGSSPLTEQNRAQKQTAQRRIGRACEIGSIRIYYGRVCL